MNRKYLQITMFIIALIAMIVYGCKKEDTPPTNNEPPVYTVGQGEVGEIGGTVKVEDPSSSINGASIEIPEGALKNNTIISIVPAPEEVKLPGDSTVQLISFEPAGLEFDKNVTITLPFNGDNIENARVYYYDNENDIVTEMPIIGINEDDRQIICETNHFSYYTACEYLMVMKMKMVYNNESFKIGAMAYIDGWATYEFGGGPFYPGLQRIPLKKKYWLAYGSRAGYLVYNEDFPVFSHFTVKLYDSDFFLPYKQKIELYIKREKVSSNAYTAFVYKYDESGVIYSTEQIEYDGEEGLETWFTGKPLIFYFDDFEFNPKKSYWIKMQWHLSMDSEGSEELTPKFELHNKEDRKKPRDMELISNEDIYNTFIDVDYVNRNQPPDAPYNPSPETHSTSVTINPMLSWECSDPDGDELRYKIYFGESEQPPLVEGNHTSKSWSPGMLDENTTYYWYVNAFEADNNIHNTNSQIWEFTTQNGGDTEPPDIFWLSHNSGETVSGTVPLTVTVTDNVGVERVEFKVLEEDEYITIATVYEPYTGVSYSCDWNTEDFSDGQHYIKVQAWDDASNSNSETIELIIDNGGGGTTGEPCPGMPTITDIDGNTYNTVLIGNQCWMKENLKVTHYPNGDAIPYITSVNAWVALNNNNTDDAYCYYNNNVNSEYGALYTYAAAIGDNWERDIADGQGICPDGWHLPTDEEWKILEGTVDTQYPVGDSEWDDTGYRGYDVGTHLKLNDGWYNNGNGDNSSGFTALPGGGRGLDGSFYYSGQYGYWWSATEYSSYNAWSRYLDYSYANVYRGNYHNKSIGLSIRCTRDE